MAVFPSRIEVHHYYHDIESEDIQFIKQGIRALLRMEQTLMTDLSALEMEVQDVQGVQASAVTVINRIADELEAARGDQVKIDAITQQLRDNAQPLADAVAANPGPDDGGGAVPPENV